MNIMIEAIGYIDDELVEKALDKRPKRNYVKYIAAVAAFIIVFAAAFAGVSHVATDGGDPVTKPLTQGFGGGDYDEKIGDGIKIEGDIITDEEIKAYVKEDKYGRIGAVAAEYGDFESEYQIFIKGYRHVNLGAENTLKLDFVDLPIMQDGKIIAMMTLYRNDDGELRSQLSAGGPTWDERTEIFEENPEDELAFFYYGFRELIITPSNRIYCIGSMSEEKLDLDRDVDYYKKFRTEYNSFSLDDLKNEANYITVIPEPEEEVSAYISDEPVEIVTNSEGEGLVATTKTVKITVDDILSKEIISVEWGNSYDLLMNKPLKKTTDEQKKKILQIISGVEPVIADDYTHFYGGGWLARLNYSDGTYALFCVKGKNQIVIENAEGVSPVYFDLSGNATEFENYLISLV